VAPDPRFDPEVVLPVLLRPGRGVYGQFIRDALNHEGFSDMPPNGGYVLGLLEPDGRALSEVISALGVSKQRASQLVDTLAVRGYVERTVDPDDRRRMMLVLTERGRTASEVVYHTVVDIDQRLMAVVGEERMVHTRETLAALVNLWTEREKDNHPHPHPHPHES
jgi:DNA-binding MarR family transcriptional regulator